MTQKQIFGIVIGVALVAVVCAFVYRQFSPADMAQQPTSSDANTKQEASGEPNPSAYTVTGIEASIVSESAADAAALEEEENGTLQEFDQDSESINNLGNSYDENSF